MQKYRDTDIRAFEFNDLQGTHVVTNSAFQNFDFKELNGKPVKNNQVTDKQVREERTHEKKHNFKIDDAVRTSRGLSRQEENDIELQIEAEVQKRLQAAYDEAFQQGREEGRAQGAEEARLQLEQDSAHKLDELSSIITTLQQQSGQVMEQNRTEVYEFVKRFTKWIVMKEINEQVYLEQLLEKLILELNARKNLIIKVGRNNFKEMPEVIKTVEARLGTLQNVRVEIVPELKHPGIILEGENGLIDGSLEGVFRNMDNIFKQVIGHE